MHSILSETKKKEASTKSAQIYYFLYNRALKHSEKRAGVAISKKKFNQTGQEL